MTSRPGIRVSDDYAATHPGVDPSCTELVINLLVAAGLVNERVETLLRPLSLTASTFNVLQILAGDPEPITPTELTARYPLPLTTATMTGLLDTLERRGWIERRRHPTDRRRVLVVLTDTGRGVCSRAEQLVLAEEPRWVAPTTPASRARLVDLLGELVDHLRASPAIEETA